MSWRKKLPAAGASELALELIEENTLPDGTEMVSLRGRDGRIGAFVVLLECVAGRASVLMLSAGRDIPDAQFWPVARRVEKLLAA